MNYIGRCWKETVTQELCPKAEAEVNLNLMHMHAVEAVSVSIVTGCRLSGTQRLEK